MSINATLAKIAAIVVPVTLANTAMSVYPREVSIALIATDVRIVALAEMIILSIIGVLVAQKYRPHDTLVWR